MKIYIIREKHDWKVFWVCMYVLVGAFGKLISLPLLILPVPQGDATNGFNAQGAHRSILALGLNSFTKVLLSGLWPWNQSISSIALISLSLRHYTRLLPLISAYCLPCRRQSVVWALFSASTLHACSSALGRECEWKRVQRLRHQINLCLNLSNATFYL